MVVKELHGLLVGLLRLFVFRLADLLLRKARREKARQCGEDEDESGKSHRKPPEPGTRH
jgi:hypothetical protein